MPAPHSLDLYRVARQCGVRLVDQDGNRSSGRTPGLCSAKATARAIGRAHGEAHLGLCFRLMTETGNGLAVYADTLTAISRVLLSGLVTIDGALFDAFDEIDLEQLRIWAQAVRGSASSSETIATALLWHLASPDKLVPPPPPEEIARRERQAAMKAIRERKERLLGAEAAC